MLVRQVHQNCSGIHLRRLGQRHLVVAVQIHRIPCLDALCIDRLTGLRIHHNRTCIDMNHRRTGLLGFDGQHTVPHFRYRGTHTVQIPLRIFSRIGNCRIRIH